MPVIVRSQLAPLALRHLQEHDVRTDDLPAASADAWEIDALHRFFDACEARANDPWLGLELAAARSVGSHGLIEFLWRSSATFREALRTLETHSRFLNDVARLELTEHGAEASFVQRVPHRLGMGRHPNEFFVATLVREVRTLGASGFVPIRARFAHPRPNLDMAPLHRAIGTIDVVWDDAATGVDFTARWLDTRLTTADEALLETLRAHARTWLPWVATASSTSLAPNLAALLRASTDAPPTLAVAARRLGVGPRTLQRHLAEQGQTFHSVRDSMLAERVRTLLEAEGASVKEVASRMGYSSTTAFVRAFRRWTGTTPTSWRRGRRAPT